MHRLLALFIFILALIFSSQPVLASPDLTFSTPLVSNITQTTAVVTWTTSVITDNRVYYAPAANSLDGQTTTSNSNTQNHSVTLSNLSPATQYIVNAYTDYQGFHRVSEYTRFTTLPSLRIIPTPTPNPVIIRNVIPPFGITGLGAANYPSGSVTIIWSTPDYPTNSYIQYYTGPGDAQVAGQNDNVTSHTVRLNNLRSSTTYSYRAKSKDQLGHEAISEVKSFSTPAASLGFNPFNARVDRDPPIITSLVAGQVTQNSIKIKWVTNEESDTWVFYSTTATDTTSVIDYEFNSGNHDFLTAGQVHQQTLTGLQPNTTYSYRVLSKDRAQNFGVSNKGTFTTLGGTSGGSSLPANQNLSNQGDVSTNPQDASDIRNEILGQAPESIEFENPPPNNEIASPSAQTSFENNKQALQDQFKKEGSSSPAVSKPLNQLVGSLNYQNIIPQLIAVFFFLTAVFVFIIFKKFAKKHIEQKIPDKKPLISTKTIIVAGTLLVVLIIVSAMAPFLASFLYTLPYYFEKTDNDKILEKMINQGRFQVKTVPIEAETKISYYPVSEEIKNLKVDCQNLPQIPTQVKGKNYYCQNIYQVNPDKLTQEVQATKAPRMILYGRYIYFDCPTNLEGNFDVIYRCFKAAKFVDDWQLPKMFSLFGLQESKDKVYLYFGKTEIEVKQICQRTEGIACIKNGNQIYSPTLNSGQVIFSDPSQVETIFPEGKNQEITYKTKVGSPQNCYTPHIHELIHYINSQYFGGPAVFWFEEGFNYLISNRIYSAICPPGPTFKETVKISEGKQEPLSSFNPDSLDQEEPLSTRLEGYSEDNQCRKTIFTQLSKYLDSQGLAFLPKFYAELKKLPSQHEVDFAKAVYLAGGSEENIKQLFRQKGCI